ncbi:MAG TPA: diacylglycerol kinase family protein [Polyangiaceae bacterium]
MQVRFDTGHERWHERRIASFRYACRGIERLFAEPNARLHAVATLAVALAGAGCRLNAFEWALVVTAAAAVWVAEALNTALEVLANAAVPERHPLVAEAKDLAAGAVLLSRSQRR